MAVNSRELRLQHATRLRTQLAGLQTSWPSGTVCHVHAMCSVLCTCAMCHVSSTLQLLLCCGGRPARSFGSFTPVCAMLASATLCSRCYILCLCLQLCVSCAGQSKPDSLQQGGNARLCLDSDLIKDMLHGHRVTCKYYQASMNSKLTVQHGAKECLPLRTSREDSGP